MTEHPLTDQQAVGLLWLIYHDALETEEHYRPLSYLGMAPPQPVPSWLAEWADRQRAQARLRRRLERSGNAGAADDLESEAESVILGAKEHLLRR